MWASLGVVAIVLVAFRLLILAAEALRPKPPKPPKIDEASKAVYEAIERAIRAAARECWLIKLDTRDDRLLMQLDSRELPIASPFGDGVLQLFEDDGLLVAPFADRVDATVHFERATDYPHADDYEKAGIDVSGQARDDLAEFFPPQQRDKLLGWPLWNAEPSAPACPQCAETMRFLAQCDEALIFNCPTHLHELALVR